MIKTNSDREKVSYIRLCPLGNRLITAIQQTPEVVNEDQLIGLPQPSGPTVDPSNETLQSDIERRLLASSRSGSTKDIVLRVSQC